MSRVPLLDVPGVTRSNGKPFRIQKLLGTSSKTEKGEELGWHTAILFLAPHTQTYNIVNDTAKGDAILRAVCLKFGWEVPDLYKQARKTVCSHAAVNNCPEWCLAWHAGRLVYEDSHHFETAKTLMYKADRDWFEDRLVEELKFDHLEVHDKVACRLNGGSDLDWTEGRNYDSVIHRLPEVQFLDYTKVPQRMFDYLDGKLPDNYHLTFSRGSSNWDTCKEVLDRGGNVSVVVRDKPVLNAFGSYDVDYLTPEGRQCNYIDGDIHDLRFLDRDYLSRIEEWSGDVGVDGGSIVLLKAKGKKQKQDTSGFILDSVRDLS